MELSQISMMFLFSTMFLAAIIILGFEKLMGEKPSWVDIIMMIYFGLAFLWEVIKANS